MVDRVSRRRVIKATGGLSSAGFALLLMAMVAAPSAMAQELTKISLRLDWAPHGMHAGLHLAKHKGWFKDAGLDVDIQDGKGTSSTITLVAAGQMEVGFAQLSAMIAARQNGLPVTAIANYIRAADSGVIVPKDAGYKSLKDLEGKRIGYTAASSSGPFIDTYLRLGGSSREKITLVNLDSSASVSTYVNKQVDGIIMTVAFFLPIVEKSRPSTALFMNAVGLRLPGYGFVTTPAVIAVKEEALKKLVAVQVKTWDYIFAGHVDEAVGAIMAERAAARLDREILKGQLVGYMPLFKTAATEGKPHGYMAEEDWALTIKLMEEAGVLKPGSKPSDYYTNRFIPTN